MHGAQNANGVGGCWICKWGNCCWCWCCFLPHVHRIAAMVVPFPFLLLVLPTLLVLTTCSCLIFSACTNSSFCIFAQQQQFDRHKLTFYFEADRRIDFRELVRELFSTYKTRIWLQQLSQVNRGMPLENQNKSKN